MKKIMFFTLPKTLKWLGMNVFLVCSLLFSEFAIAQINYSEDFATDVGGWTRTGGWTTYPQWVSSNYCTAAGAITMNLYSSEPTGTHTSPMVGVSNAGQVTLNYSYKVQDYDSTTPSPGADAAPANFGTVDIQYGASASGPWTTVQTIGGSGDSHTPSQTCEPKTVTFTPPA